jgi:uncharacterized membrane-anchored protein YitT (DUF2179 family)
MAKLLDGKVFKIVALMFGISIMAFGINAFFSSNGLVTGGFSGLAIVISELSVQMFDFSIPLWLSNTVLNIPLFIAGLRIFGMKKLSLTVFSAFYLSFALYYTEFATKIIDLSGDFFLVSVFGGLVVGIGLAIIIRCGATTGGTDTLGMISNHFNKRVSIARFMMIYDVCVTAMGFFVFGPIRTLYSVITIAICAFVCDSVLEGLNFAKAMFIISEKSEEIADALMKEVERGVSSLFARGMYSRKEKDILLIVVSKREINPVKDIVQRHDARAFVIVCDVREVLGEGFQENHMTGM